MDLATREKGKLQIAFVFKQRSTAAKQKKMNDLFKPGSAKRCRLKL